MKLYTLNSVFDFGQYKGENLKNVFEKNPVYINWCFQKIDWFCISDELYNLLPITLPSQTPNEKSLEEFAKEHIINMYNLHEQKKLLFQNFNQKKEDKFNDYENKKTSNWLADASGTNDPETMNDVYWNLD